MEFTKFTLLMGNVTIIFMNPAMSPASPDKTADSPCVHACLSLDLPQAPSTTYSPSTESGRRDTPRDPKNNSASRSLFSLSVTTFPMQLVLKRKTNHSQQDSRVYPRWAIQSITTASDKWDSKKGWQKRIRHSDAQQFDNFGTKSQFENMTSKSLNAESAFFYQIQESLKHFSKSKKKYFKC